MAGLMHGCRGRRGRAARALIVGVVGGVGAVAAGSLLGTAAAPASTAAAAQPPQNMSDIAVERKYRDRTSTAWIPPGKYSAIVISTNAPTRRWIVSLKTTKGTFPITIAPAQTTVIPFNEPWTVVPNDQARIESIDVPFGDIGRETPLQEGNLCLSAWGITDRGPVMFVIKP